MIYKLLTHSWLSFWRSKTLNRSLATTIFTWIMTGVIMLYALGLGVMLEKILISLSSDKEPIELLNGLLIYYWMFELLFRIIFQRNVTLNIQYYLTLRISNNTLGHYMLMKSWVNLFSLISVLLFAPFAINIIASTHDPLTASVWLGFIIAVGIFLHHFVIALNQLSIGKSLPPLLLGATILLAAYFNYLGYVDFTFVTVKLFNFVFVNLAIILVPLLLSALLYYYDLRLVVGNLYLDSIPTKINVAADGVSRWVTYLNSFGAIGLLIALELRLIWRNKRPRTVVISGILMAAYFVYFLFKVDHTSFVNVFFLVTTGAIMINYGQLLFSWESAYFDFLMTRNFSIKIYLLSKFTLFFIFNTLLMLVLGSVFAFIDMVKVKDLIIWYLINTGFFIYIFIGGTMLGPKRLDVNARAMFNYEGINIFQFLVLIPYFLFPLGAIYFFDSFIGEFWRNVVLILFGLSGIFFYRSIIGLLAKIFTKRKYKILDGFRE